MFRGYPVMAMIRLATAASAGKANLHQGAVGVGLDVASGRAVGAVQFDRPCPRHPDTGRELFDLRISGWVRFLRLAAGCYEMTGLGYLGANLVLDRRHGPMMLELNARPGLAIQMANGEGLGGRLEQIERERDGADVETRVAFSMRHFERLGAAGGEPGGRGTVEANAEVLPHAPSHASSQDPQVAPGRRPPEPVAA